MKSVKESSMDAAMKNTRAGDKSKTEANEGLRGCSGTSKKGLHLTWDGASRVEQQE
jgi:hypothetical protein